MPELGIYILPGRIVDPKRAVEDTWDAERLGIGTAWISERYDQKDAAVLLGAMAQRTSRISVATGVVHPHTRHLLLLAAFGSTIQALSGGRGVIGLGRGVAEKWRDMGLTPPTLRSLSDSAMILRQLWSGEEVWYEGPAGRLRGVRMTDCYPGSPPRLMLAAQGPRTVQMAGRFYDGVITHMMTPEAVGRTAAQLRDSARQAQRDPDQVRLSHVLVVAPEASAEHEATVVGGRLVTYLMSRAKTDLIAGLNGWDPADIAALHEHPLLQRDTQVGKGSGFFRRADQSKSLQDLAAVSELIPRHWVDGLVAAGSSTACAKRVREYLDAGADEVILHASTPRQVVGLVAEHRRISAGLPRDGASLGTHSSSHLKNLSAAAEETS